MLSSGDSWERPSSGVLQASISTSKAELECRPSDGICARDPSVPGDGLQRAVMSLRRGVMLGGEDWAPGQGTEGPRRTPARQGEGTARAGFAECDFRHNPGRQAGIGQGRGFVGGLL